MEECSDCSDGLVAISAIKLCMEIVSSIKSLSTGSRKINRFQCLNTETLMNNEITIESTLSQTEKKPSIISTNKKN